MTFSETPLISGSAITHQAGSAQVEIHQNGVYQAAFHSTAAVNPGTAIPATVTAQLYLNGAPVSGAITRHTFASTNEAATLSFNVPFLVDAAPSTVEVVVAQDGFTFSDLALTITRLGEATNVRSNV